MWPSPSWSATYTTYTCTSSRSTTLATCGTWAQSRRATAEQAWASSRSECGSTAISSQSSTPYPPPPLSPSSCQQTPTSRTKAGSPTTALHAESRPVLTTASCHTRSPRRMKSAASCARQTPPPSSSGSNSQEQCDQRSKRQAKLRFQLTSEIAPSVACITGATSDRSLTSPCGSAPTYFRHAISNCGAIWTV